jgi:hypothetical protein
MALYMYFTKHPGDQGMEKLRGAHIVTVRNLDFRDAETRDVVSEQIPYERIVVYDPCATDQLGKKPDGPIRKRPRTFGCAQSVEKFGLNGVLRDLDATTESHFETFELKSGEGGFSVEQVLITCRNPENQAKRALAFGA